jgi:hypothetical protein
VLCRKENDEDRPDADTLFVAKRGDEKPVRDEGYLNRWVVEPPLTRPQSELKAVFQKYGDVKRIGATPRTLLAKFVQFYDVRSIPKGDRRASVVLKQFHLKWVVYLALQGELWRESHKLVVRSVRMLSGGNIPYDGGTLIVEEAVRGGRGCFQTTHHTMQSYTTPLQMGALNRRRCPLREAMAKETSFCRMRRDALLRPVSSHLPLSIRPLSLPAHWRAHLFWTLDLAAKHHNREAHYGTRFLGRGSCSSVLGDSSFCRLVGRQTHGSIHQASDSVIHCWTATRFFPFCLGIHRASKCASTHPRPPHVQRQRPYALRCQAPQLASFRWASFLNGAQTQLAIAWSDTFAAPRKHQLRSAHVFLG